MATAQSVILYDAQWQ